MAPEQNLGPVFIFRYCSCNNGLVEPVMRILFWALYNVLNFCSNTFQKLDPVSEMFCLVKVYTRNSIKNIYYYEQLELTRELRLQISVCSWAIIVTNLADVKFFQL
jgi:hypothetical protein